MDFKYKIIGGKNNVHNITAILEVKIDAKGYPTTPNGEMESKSKR